MQKIKNIAIVYRANTPDAFNLAKDIAKWAKKHKISAFHHPEQKPIPLTKKLNTPLLKKIDLALVLGGDGTYLFAVRFLCGHNIPVLGINMGSLGFLTETRKEDIYHSLELALKNKLVLQNRTLLDVEIHKKGKTSLSLHALNDIVIERGQYSRLINLAIYSNDQLVSELKADGLIISTPTGSTAYNLAAGGPIVHPETPAIIITPICPHSLTIRPIILPDNQVIRIKINSNSQKGYFMVDGQKEEFVGPNDELVLRKAKVPHLLATNEPGTYFDLLKTKLQFGQRV